MKFTKIKGDNRPQNIVKLPELGRIRLGVKVIKSETTSYPKETDYFVCPDEVRRVYGNQPKSLPVMLPVEDEEKFVRQFYACYGSNQKIKCIGDGELCERRVKDGDTVVKKELPCPHPDNCEYGKENKCHARIVLQVVLPGVNMGGVYQLSSGSVNSDIDIRSGIEMSKNLFGRISWVPMILQREEKKIPDPATGAMQTHWPVKLFPYANIEQANEIRNDTRRILEHQQNIQLPEPIIESTLPDDVSYIPPETPANTASASPDNTTASNKGGAKSNKKYDRGQAIKCPAIELKIRLKTDCESCDKKADCEAWAK